MFGKYIGTLSATFESVSGEIDAGVVVAFNCFTTLLKQFVISVVLYFILTGNSDRNRDDEILNILKTDTNDEEDPTKLW